MAAHLQRICQEEAIEAEEEALNVIAQKQMGHFEMHFLFLIELLAFLETPLLIKMLLKTLTS